MYLSGIHRAGILAMEIVSYAPCPAFRSHAVTEADDVIPAFDRRIGTQHEDPTAFGRGADLEARVDRQRPAVVQACPWRTTMAAR